MDIARPRRNRTPQRLLLAAGALVLLGGSTFALSRLEPAAPTVERSTLWIDAVTRGPFVREVRGNGTLVPEEIRWIAAAVAARVERIAIQPGAAVAAGDVLLELAEPELVVRAREAALALGAAEADLAALAARLDHSLLDQQAAVAGAEADATEARLQLEADEELGREGLVSQLQLRIARVRAEEVETRRRLEADRLTSTRDSNAAQLAAQRARVEQMRALAALRQEEVDGLHVRAGIDGVLQAIAIEPGQQVTPGTVLARVARPDRLKAELRVPETQARDVAIGLAARIDTRNGVVDGRVVRIDPAVTQGTVVVDVALVGELPRGARPDLSVEGTIEIERLDDALTVGRPAFGQPETKLSLFRLSLEGNRAERVEVAFGRGSVHRLEVLSGLAEGDRVILSDMSTWSAHDRLRLD